MEPKEIIEADNNSLVEGISTRVFELNKLIRLAYERGIEFELYGVDMSEDHPERMMIVFSAMTGKEK